MKKIISILCTAALIASLTGCSSGGSSDTSGDSQASSPVSDSNDSIDSSGGSGSSDVQGGADSSDSSPAKPQEPDGEPTFLIGLDGEPVYTSELSEICKIDRETHEEIPVEALDHENLFNVVCDGFTYVYMPRPAVNCMDDPELFEDEYYYYIGEELSDNYEFLRVNVGDKIGDLTVRSASALFRAVYGSDDVYERGLVEFDGEIELTGFVNVEIEAPLYPGGGGNITFFPDAESSVKIPMTFFDRNYDNGKARHLVWNEFGWYGDRSWLALGNIADIDSELREGDEFVKVKVTVKDITLGYWASAVIKDIELV